MGTFSAVARPQNGIIIFSSSTIISYSGFSRISTQKCSQHNPGHAV